MLFGQMRLLTFILTINSVVCYGQDIFADNIKNFPWTSDEQFDIEQIQKTKEIGLSMLRIPIDSLKTNRTIWAFKDELTLSHYSPKNREDKMIFRCKYDFDWDKGLLNIQWPDKGQLTYTYTFVSTGSFILLTRKTKK
jgi:hypothetical protein